MITAMGDSTPTGQRTIAQKLSFLIETVHPADRGPYSYKELSDLIKKQAEEKKQSGTAAPTVSHSAIHAIATGKVTNPGVQAVAALADFFGVPASHFLDESDDAAARAERLEARLLEVRENLDRAKAGDELAEVLEDKKVRAVAFRLSGLSANTLQGVKNMLDGIRQAEGLPSAEEDAVPVKGARSRRRKRSS
ncbi:XRE family transcriptional regulator [Streptomyces sp. NPDC050610]|uniref:XRE family transcriptional regulator n=1 Tax=Streptomyces sp. NPDC050610 TaxID=3157097 RepID=UPI003421A525